MSYQADVRSRPALRENCHPWFRSPAQKLRGREPDRLDSPRFPGSRDVARALRLARRGLPGNDLSTEAARGGVLHQVVREHLEGHCQVADQSAFLSLGAERPALG